MNVVNLMTNFSLVSFILKFIWSTRCWCSAPRQSHLSTTWRRFLNISTTGHLNDKHIRGNIKRINNFLILSCSFLKLNFLMGYYFAACGSNLRGRSDGSSTPVFIGVVSTAAHIFFPAQRALIPCIDLLTMAVYQAIQQFNKYACSWILFSYSMSWVLIIY